MLIDKLRFIKIPATEQAGHSVRVLQQAEVFQLIYTSTLFTQILNSSLHAVVMTMLSIPNYPLPCQAISLET